MRKRILVITLTFFVFALMQLIYSKINMQGSHIEAYILKNNIIQGQVVKTDDVEKIKIRKSNNDEKSGNAENLENVENAEKFYFNLDNKMFIAKQNLNQGQIINNKLVVSQDEYKEIADDKEVISIRISNIEDCVSYQIKKHDNVNIYYTGKSDLALSILERLNVPTLDTNKKMNEDIIGFDNGYITARILEKICILKMFDKYGNEIENSERFKSEKDKIDNIMIKVDKKEVEIINNLKKYGEFSLSIVK